MRLASSSSLRAAVASCLIMWWSSSGAQPPARAPLQLRTHQVVDQQQGGLVLATLIAPADWRVQSYVRWRYDDVSQPVRSGARIEAPDGSAWVELFASEMFYWLDPVRSPVALGARSLGMIHWPQIDVARALQKVLVPAYRGKQPSLQVLGLERVDPAALAAAFNQPPVAGDAAVVRLRYLANGQPVEERIYGLLGRGNVVPYTGPQGTWYESHRPLLFGHAMGATQGRFDRVQPLLSAIVGTVRIEPAWVAHYEQVQAKLNEAFNANIQRGYATIAAAAATSRQISANNDALLSSMQQQRQRQAQIDAQRRSEYARGANSTTAYSDAMRGITRLEDAYSGGETWRSNTERYHWTDGMGNYRSSNDASFDPNVGAGGGPSWKLMEPAR